MPLSELCVSLLLDDADRHADSNTRQGCYARFRHSLSYLGKVAMLDCQRAMGGVQRGRQRSTLVYGVPHLFLASYRFN